MNAGLAILAEFRQLEAELSDINHLNKGLLRLGIPPMVGMLMAGPISLFRQRYPGVELKISEFGGLTVQQAVMNGELDVAMTALPVEEASGLTTLSLFSHPLCVLVPRSGQWTTCDSIAPEALAEHPLLIYNEDFALSRQLMTLFSQHDVKPRIVPCAAGNGIFSPPWCKRASASPFCRSRFVSVWIRPRCAGYRWKAISAGSWHDLARGRVSVAQRPGMVNLLRRVLAETTVSHGLKPLPDGGASTLSGLLVGPVSMAPPGHKDY
ncbi:LysR family regulatory protein [Salmonella enterica subsp. enterica]|uniref:LysR family regulatory protein n=1 Tax=Salmonella enterica I TaxID=59201 RepID=A0A379V1A0_SALET|nr:LysR family regulatory protein [Salmonella enterica subsp. enterica]